MLSAIPCIVRSVCFSVSLGGFLERWVVLKHWVTSCYQEMIMDPSLCELLRVTAWASWSQVCEFVTAYILKAVIGDWSSESSILVRTQDKAKHFKIYQTSGQFYVDPSPTFASVLEVVEYYRTHPLSTSDKLKQPCIRVRHFFSVHFSSLSSLMLVYVISLIHTLSFSFVIWGSDWKRFFIFLRTSASVYFH